jgi:hypothetical protein
VESGELIAASLGEDLHAAVMIIAHPSGDTQNVRFAFDEPPETDPLHASADEVTAGLHRLWGIAHENETRYRTIGAMPK